MSRPAPTRTISASAVWPTTSIVRVAPVRRLAEPRVASSFSSALVLPRSTATAGTRPKISPVTIASAIVNSRTAGCIAGCPMAGNCCSLSATSARNHA